MQILIEYLINYLVVVLGKLFGGKLYKDSHLVDKTPKQTQIGDKDE
mgnify:CR=1 FL=1